MATSMMHIRIDDDLKRDATATLEAMGLTCSDAVRLFLKRVVADQAIPFAIKVPNAETVAAMREAQALSARFATAEALFDDLEAER
ncbi:type II toxin-antitoxin system RelB/DinJ family antitoxin [Prosthecomicrobium hirschii]|uniref:Damage-inducible protein n=1 Tax=Prosthecodimorpha hirschii TaxID=665126 RepID=A0A0N8GET3_9HYPH|nr:type II toxin-antitoxin system RelB/DinJ family antitoxin [Prosthecomicrobium hirschii]KPL52401.1 hypothetical protein ABB55_09305 [Prosthecomicrobium hirschii]MCW1843187.1 type II toxin-antitoxin system RelB/DinJ family antitoxin [Prosthecomicrobium hirschii]